MAETENNVLDKEVFNLPDISDDDEITLDLSDINDDELAGFPSFLTEKKEEDIELAFDDLEHTDLGLDDINVVEPSIEIPQPLSEEDIVLGDETTTVNLEDVAVDSSHLPADNWSGSENNPDDFLDTPLPETEIGIVSDLPEQESDTTEISEDTNELPDVSENNEDAVILAETGDVPAPIKEIAEEPVIAPVYSDDNIAEQLGDNEDQEVQPISVSADNNENEISPSASEPLKAEDVPVVESVIRPYPGSPCETEKEINRCLKWYSGHIRDKYIEFSARHDSGEVDGASGVNALNIKVGYSYYGWNVRFDNGLSMSLQDVRDYQLYYGKLPDHGGVVSFGELTLTFKNIERIVSYQIPEYYSYGI